MSIETEREYKRGKRASHGLNLTTAYEYLRPYSLQILIGYFILFFMVIFLSIPEENLIELRTPDSLTKLSSRTVANSITGLVELREKIHSASEVARERKSVFPNKVQSSLLQDVSGVEFVVVKVFPRDSDVPQKVKASSPSEVNPSDPGFSDPLDVKNLNSDLVVVKYDEILGYDYTLALNKFNTLTDHALIVSNAFKLQSLPLNHNDFTIWYLTLTAMNGVGFFNSNGIAGASQPHKHLQVVPNDVLWHLRGKDAAYPIALDNFVRPRIQQKVFSPLPAFRRLQRATIKQRIYKIPEFNFEHGLVVFSERLAKTKEELILFYGEYLENIYDALLHEVGIDKNTLINCAENSHLTLSSKECEVRSAYNMVLTDSYMFVVPRSELKFNENINGMGFMGLLLANSKESEDMLRKAGPITALASVSKPLEP